MWIHCWMGHMTEKERKWERPNNPCAFFSSVFTGKTRSSCNYQKSLEEIIFLSLYKVIAMQEKLFGYSLNFSYLKIEQT